MAIISTIQAVASAGTLELNPSEKKRVLLVNWACLVMMGICLFFIFPWLLKGSIKMVTVNVAMIIFYGGLIWLNSKGLHAIPKFIFIFFLSTSVFVAADAMGKSINYHFSLVPIAGFSALLFDPREKLKVFFAVSYPMFLLGLLVIFDFGLLPNILGNFPAITVYFQFFINAFILSVTTFYLYRSSVNAESNYKYLYEKHVLASKELDHARASAAYSSKMSSLGELAGSIAHEVRSPLSFIVHNAELLQRDLHKNTFSKEKVNTHLNNIIDTGFKISKIISSLTSFSHSSGVRELSLIQVQKVLEDVLIICNQRIHIKSIKVDLDIEEGLPKIVCHQTEVAQVIINIMNNALDAIENSREGKITIRAKDHGTHLSLSFENNGPLIPEDIRESIFEDYFTTKGIGKGTGLGLSISKKLIEANKGKLYLDTSSPFTKFVCEFEKDQN